MPFSGPKAIEKKINVSTAEAEIEEEAGATHH
jgi:hypothetical protein